MSDLQEVGEKNSTQNSSANTSEPKVTDKKKKNQFAVKEEITEENCTFEDGQILNFVKVRFPGHAKSYAFLIGKRNLSYGQKVMAMSDRGMAVGYINSFSYKIPFSKNLLPLRSINKTATQEDIDKERENYKKQKEVETLCQNLIEKHKLDMNLTHVEFTQFGKKVVFYFSAPARVDFRGLVKDMVSELRLRIELRQISVRDRAASQGALGPCGRELCCSSFLSKYGNVSIRMAKNQNLTLNYSKLNGVCGQLKCCLQYEDEVYSQKRKNLPNEGTLIKTLNGDSGKIRKLYILNEQFDMLTDKGKIRRYTADQYVSTYKLNELKFPRQFDNISDDTGTIIGLTDKEAKTTRQFERDMEKITKNAHSYAIKQIENISDFLPERDRTKDDHSIQTKAVDHRKEIPLAFDEMNIETPQVKIEPTNDKPKDTVEASSQKKPQPRTTKKKYYKKNNKNRNNNNRNNSNNKSRPKE